jgi:hypothetical protein
MTVVELRDKTRKCVFHLTAFEDIKLDTERRGYLVKGLLPDSGLGVIWGPPKCYKSFWAVDVGLHIALGRDYRGRRVEQVGVVYIGLEGRHGLPARIEAFKKHHDVDRALFHLVTAPLNLKKQVDVLVADIEAQLIVRPGIVFIDTLNRSLAGSESKDEDMAAYLAAAAKIEQRFNCLVLLVHHCGIEGSRPRGHSSLTAAVDVQLAVERIADREMVVRVELAKDMAEGAEIYSRLETVVLGTDPDGDMITSFVVLPAAAKNLKGASADLKLSKNQQTMLSLIRAAGPSGLTTELWNEKARKLGIGAKRRADLHDLREGLKTKKLVQQDGERWAAIQQSDDPQQESMFGVS